MPMRLRSVIAAVLPPGATLPLFTAANDRIAVDRRLRSSCVR
jgi:hypothetical protein